MTAKQDDRTTVKQGDRLPDAVFPVIGPDGTGEVRLRDLTSGRRVVIFAVPGAFTPTCDSAHMPSFVRNAEALRSRGVDAILCVSVNDAHVMRRWGQATGALDAGIVMLADGESAFTRALGLDYSTPATGMFNRSRRYAMLVDDGVVTRLHLDRPGVCELSTGEAILAAL